MASTGDDGGDENNFQPPHKRTRLESSSSSAAVAAVAAVEEEESSKSSGEEETERRNFKNLPPNFPSRFIQSIRDPESIRPRILIEKKLHKANIDENRIGLPISAKRMKESFLLADEEEELKSGKVKRVKVIEPGGDRVRTLLLRKRTQRPSYLLYRGWKDMVARNRNALKRKKVLRVWYFRVRGALWFAFEVVERGRGRDRRIAKQNLDKWFRQNVFGF